MRIIRGNKANAVSSRYVLYHALFSTATFALRLNHDMYYPHLNCVKMGFLVGWKAYSALLGFIQSGVQWLGAMMLLATLRRSFLRCVLWHES